MIYVYSKIELNKLLHQINKFDDIHNRTNLCNDDSFIQCASLGLDKGITFLPHIHITRERYDKDYTPQESWVVIKGSVLCKFYDLDGTFLCSYILYEGDASFTFYGGHTYEILEDNTKVYEYKTGRYEGQQKDKRFI